MVMMNYMFVTLTDTSSMYFILLKDPSSRSKRSTNDASAFEFTIGEDQSCFSSGGSFYCNGPLDPGKKYKYVLNASNHIK